MKIEMNEKVFSTLLCAFLGMGACAYGCIFATYVLWFMGFIDQQMKKSITVEMTFAWTFDEKDWIQEKKHIQMMKDHPRIVFGKDMMNSFYCLNDIVFPELKNIKVVNANK